MVLYYVQPVHSISTKKKEKSLHSYCTPSVFTDTSNHYVNWVNVNYVMNLYNYFIVSVTCIALLFKQHFTNKFLLTVTNLPVSSEFLLSALCTSVRKMKVTAVYWWSLLVPGPFHSIPFHHQRPDESLHRQASFIFGLCFRVNNWSRNNCQQCKGRPQSNPHKGLWREFRPCTMLGRRGIFALQQSLSRENNTITESNFSQGQTQLGLEILESRYKVY